MDPSGQRRLGMRMAGPHSVASHGSDVAGRAVLRGPSAAAEPEADLDPGGGDTDSLGGG
jgi:hypothetical protein